MAVICLSYCSESIITVVLPFVCGWHFDGFIVGWWLYSLPLFRSDVFVWHFGRFQCPRFVALILSFSDNRHLRGYNETFIWDSLLVLWQNGDREPTRCFLFLLVFVVFTCPVLSCVAFLAEFSFSGFLIRRFFLLFSNSFSCARFRWCIILSVSLSRVNSCLYPLLQCCWFYSPGIVSFRAELFVEIGFSVPKLVQLLHLGNIMWISGGCGSVCVFGANLSMTSA